MTVTLPLSARLDLAAAQPLADRLRDSLGHPVVVDAAHVTHLGGLCLQVLIAAAREWRARGQRFVVAPRSLAFDDALLRFGVGATLFALEDAP